MKRLQTTHKSPLRKLKLLLVGLIAATGMLVPAQGASALQTAAPEILTKPSNPNTTHATATFTYTKGAGETSPIEFPQFHCRQYPTASPPASPSTGWFLCYSQGDVIHSKSYSNLANVSQTFEVAARDHPGGGFSTQGPISSYTWVQSVPAITKAPVLTQKPSDPQVTSPTNSNRSFTIALGVGEENLADRYQCRVDSNQEEDWVTCNDNNAGYNPLIPGNGEHKIDVRAGNIHGYGPIVSHEWTVAIPDPDPKVTFEDVATTRWDGTVSNARIGNVTSASSYRTKLVVPGDINGDGRNDYVIGSNASSLNQASVIFSTPNGQGIRNFGSLNAAEGYQIVLPGVAANSGISAVGDQNGDDIPDMMIRSSTSNFAAGVIYIVYGISDPSVLPFCPSSTTVRCQTLASITDAEGYRLTAPNATRFGSNWAESAGDFDDDGIEDFLVGTSDSFDTAYVVKGKVRTGTVMADTLPTTEILKIDGSFPDLPLAQFNAHGGNGVGDVNGDGFDDVFVAESNTQGGGYVVFGHVFDASPFVVANPISPEDGFRLFGPSAAQGCVRGIADRNGDGITDMTGVVKGSLGTADNEVTVSVMYSPENPADGTFIGPGHDGSMGYDIDSGRINASLGYGTGGCSAGRDIGDFNNDGLLDLAMSATAIESNGGMLGEANAVGAAFLVFGQEVIPEEGIHLLGAGSEGKGLAMVGSTPGEQAGTIVLPLGDIDDDGLTDFVVSSWNPVNTGPAGSGSVYVVPGKNLINQVKTGTASEVTNTEATLKAPFQSNGRGTEVKFEYGTTDEYGSETDIQEFEASNGGDAAFIDVEGLERNTEYHYRAVATNELGLTRYGDDMTFTTTNVDDPIPPSNCDTDDTLPGCDNWDPCAADDTKPGCKNYDHCAVMPADCVTGSPDAKLGLISAPKTIKVKRGKKGSVSVSVFNSGGKSAGGVKVCVKAPKKFVKVKKCQSLGSLGSGATKTRTFKVTVKKKAKKGKKVNLAFKATGSGLGAKTAKAKVIVK